MKRSQRLGVVRGVMHEEERRCAEALATSEKRLANAASRLQELQRYRADYARQFEASGGQAISASVLQNYQIFLARLDGAIQQQDQIRARASAELEFERGRWRDAAVRLKSLSAVIAKWETQRRIVADRNTQNDIDERALRMATGRAAFTSDPT